MSMIGIFGLCQKSKYEALVKLVKNKQFKETESLVNEMNMELRESSEKMDNGKCSGEVFLALFEFFKEEYGIDVRGEAEFKETAEQWRDITGDFDMIAFQEKETFLNMEDGISYDKISQFVSDFFEADYGNMGETACKMLFDNLRKLESGEVLIWQLC